MEEWKKAVQDQKVIKCSCGGLVKPDIVFFGESLPKEFATACDLMDEADLVIVMGTSLVVYPFAFLVDMVKPQVPLVLINNTDSRKQPPKSNSIWLDDSLDERVKELADAFKW